METELRGVHCRPLVYLDEAAVGTGAIGAQSSHLGQVVFSGAHLRRPGRHLHGGTVRCRFPGTRMDDWFALGTGFAALVRACGLVDAFVLAGAVLTVTCTGGNERG